MKKWLKRIAVIFAVGVLLLPITVVFANWLNPPATIVNDLAIGLNPSSVYGMTFQPDRQTFYANGRHWIFYINDDSDFVYKTALANGVFGAETELVNNTGIYGFEMAVFYDATNNRVHYARHDMTPAPDEVKYRMGTPNADGTITWAAVEQTVAQVPAALLTWRTTIVVDEDGYPWVGYIDTDGTNTFGILYVESSSTKNGTWTGDVTQSFGSGGVVADGTGTMTGSPVTLDVGLNQPTVTADGTFTITLPVGGAGTATSDGWVITGSPVALVEGVNTITVEAAGAGTIDIELADIHVWFAGITPIGTGTAKVEVQWTAENNTSGDVGLYASVYDTGTGWSTQDEVVAEGSMYATRPDAFSFYDLGSAIRVVYTDDTGNVMYRVRSAIQTWAACDPAVQILAAGASVWLPTISGYRLLDGGEDFLCVVHNDVEVKYSIHDFGTATWGAFTLAWTVPDVANDVISRHIATYKYDTTSDTVGFAWQWTDASATDDTIQYWWLYNIGDQLGYYDSGLPTTVTPMANIIPLIFLGMGILVILAIALADNLNVKMMVFLAIAIMLILAFLSSMNWIVNSF